MPASTHKHTSNLDCEKRDEAKMEENGARAQITMRALLDIQKKKKKKKKKKKLTFGWIKRLSAAGDARLQRSTAIAILLEQVGWGKE